MPSAPGYPAERASAQRRASYRSNESFDWYESQRTILAAGTAFQEVAQFSGEPDSIVVGSDTAGIDIRFRYPGEAAGTPIRVQQVGAVIYAVQARIVEARDAAGVGGQALSITGRFASRGIDVRQNRPGPSRERPPLPESELATQVATSE